MKNTIKKMTFKNKYRDHLNYAHINQVESETGVRITSLSRWLAIIPQKAAFGKGMFLVRLKRGVWLFASRGAILYNSG